jgi:hypothetical protein
MKTVDIGKEFSDSLTNRDEFQRDGKFTGVDFREKFLNELENKEMWANNNPFITLDFVNVKRLGPSWANEVFAFFTQFAKPNQILKKIVFLNISSVKRAIIEKEIETGYSKK